MGNRRIKINSIKSVKIKTGKEQNKINSKQSKMKGIKIKANTYYPEFSDQ